MGNTTVKERIMEFISSRGISKNSFESKAGLSTGYLRQLRHEPSREKIESIILAFPEINRNWLLTGDGEMLKSDDEPTQSTSNVIPLLPIEAVAGSLSGWAESVTLRDCKKIISPIPGADFAIQISGDSMEPELQNGSYVYIKRINERAFIPWGNTMVVDTENGVVVKKLFPIDGDDCSILAKSVNANYPPFKIPTDSIIGIYRVLGGSFIVSTL